MMYRPGMSMIVLKDWHHCEAVRRAHSYSSIMLPNILLSQKHF